MLFVQMLDELNKRLSTVLARFNFKYGVRWASDGNILYKEESDTTEHNASQLSGGQKYILVIAIRLVLLEMLNSSFPVFALDEPTTGLDVDNRQLLADVLSNLAKDYPKLVLVIPTHDELLLPDAKVVEV